MFILAASFTIASGIVFFLGILIGQGIEQRKLLKREEPLVKIPVHPSAKGSGASPGASAKEEITFYDTLAKGSTGAQPSRVGSPVEIKPPGKTPKQVGRETKGVAQEVAVAPPQKAEEKAALKPERQKEPPAEKTPQAEETKPETVVRVWAVQVNAYPNERDAKSLAKKLQDKGYDAYVVSADIRGKTWYRVRVGRLASRQEAQELQETLKARENFTKAITTSR